MGTSEKRPPGSFEIPDLELDAPAARPPAPSTKPARFDFDDLDEGFELETAQSSLGLGVDAESLPVSGERPRSVSAAAPWPSGATPGPDQLRLETEEVTRIANYGEPGAFWLAPAYTLRVFSRRRALQQTRSESRAELTACESRRDATLAELVRTLRPELSARAQFRAALTELAAAEKAAGEQERVLASASAEAQTKLAGIDAQSGALRSEIDAQQDLLASRQSHFDECSANLTRAEARAKRVQIEIRGLEEVAVKRATAAAKPVSGQVELTAEEAQRRSVLVQQQKTLGEELSLVRAPYAAAEQELAAVRRRIGELERQLGASEQQKTAFTRRARQDLSAKGKTANQAGSALSQAFAELGRAVLSGRGAVKVDDEMLERLRQHDKEVLRAAINDELHSRALSAYDHDRAKQGLWLAAGAVVLLLALLIYASL